MKTPHLATVTPSGYLDSCWQSRLNSHNNGKGKEILKLKKSVRHLLAILILNHRSDSILFDIKASRSKDRAMSFFSVSLGREFPQTVINLERFLPIGKANWRDLQIKISTGIKINQLAFHSKTWKGLAGRHNCPHGVPPLIQLPRCPPGW